MKKLNNKGFGVIELAAWIIVTAFVAKVVAVAIVGASVLSADSKLNHPRYNDIHVSLADYDPTANTWMTR